MLAVHMALRHQVRDQIILERLDGIVDRARERIALAERLERVIVRAPREERLEVVPRDGFKFASCDPPILRSIREKLRSELDGPLSFGERVEEEMFGVIAERDGPHPACGK